MKDNSKSTTALLEPREKPDAALMVQELKDTISEARSAGLFDRLRTAHRTRRCWWENQQNDGKVAQQADKTWLPWKGAIDHRVALAHKIVTELTMLQMAVFNRGDEEVKPRQTIEDLDQANTWSLVFKYFLECQMPGLLMTVRDAVRKSVRLLFDAKNELGYSIVRCRWRGRRALVERKITAEKVIAAIAEEAQGPMLEASETGELTPDEKQTIQTFVMELWSDYLEVDEIHEGFLAVLQMVDPDMPMREAKRVAREFRGGEMEVTYNAPADAGGVPEVTTLVPWLNCGHTLDLSDQHGATAFFEREIYTEHTLKARAEEEDWDDVFLAEVLRNPNTSLFDAGETWADDGKTILNGTSFLLEMSRSGNSTTMYEIIRRTGRAVNKAGLETMYETVLHHGAGTYGRHISLSKETHEQMFIPCSFEPTVNTWLSRGVPEIILTFQAGLKKLYDAETCRAEISSVPPMSVDSDNANVRPMPGMVMPSSRLKNEFLRGPEADNGAYRLRQELKEEVDEMFYRGSKVDPELKRVFREDLAAEAAATLGQVYRGMWKLIQRHTDTVRASRVAGQPVNLNVTREALQGDPDISISFNIGVFSDKMVENFVNMGVKIIQSDRSGATDVFEFTKACWQMFDPSAARRMVRPRGATTDAEMREVKARISAMVAGQHVDVPDDINFELWEQAMREWMANPETTAMLQSRPMLMKEATGVWDAIQFQKTQKTENVTWGRTGQAPVAPWLQEGAAAA